MQSKRRPHRGLSRIGNLVKGKTSSRESVVAKETGVITGVEIGVTRKEVVATKEEDLGHVLQSPAEGILGIREMGGKTIVEGLPIAIIIAVITNVIAGIAMITATPTGRGVRYYLWNSWNLEKERLMLRRL